MAETTLNAPGFSATWATVRLEPTQIGARGGPAFPELLIPLYVTLQSVEPQLHYNAYFPTGDDPNPALFVAPTLRVAHHQLDTNWSHSSHTHIFEHVQQPE